MQTMPTRYAALLSQDAVKTTWIHLLRSNECAYRQALVFPSPANADAHAFKPMSDHPLYIILELSDGRCLKITHEGKHARLLKPHEIARLLSSRPEWSFTEDQHDEAASMYLSDHMGMALKVGPVNFTDKIHKDYFLSITDIVLHLGQGQTTAQKWKDCINEKLDAFRSNLSSTLLGALQDAEWQDSRAYNWLLNDPTIQYRLQALEAQPLLGKVISSPRNDTWLIPTSEQLNKKELTEHIDQAKELHAVMATKLNVQLEVVRWLRRKPLELIGHEWAMKTEELYVLLAAIPPEKRPVTSTEWQIMTQLYLAIQWRSGEQLESLFQKWMLHFALQGWETCKRKLIKHRKTESEFALARQYAYAIYDYLDRPDSPDTAKQYMQNNEQSPWRWLADALVWQERINLEEARIFASHQSWPMLLAQPWQTDSIIYTELDSEAALEVEGQEQGHCVGSYAMHCRFGQAHIFSILNPQTGERTTAHFNLVRTKTGILIELAEHMGKSNQTPSDEAQSAIQDLIGYLNTTKQQSHNASLYEQAEIRAVNQPMFDRTNYGHELIRLHVGVEIEAINTKDQWG